MAKYRPRKDPTPADYAKIGAGVLAGGALIVTLLLMQTQGAFGGPPEAAALVNNAGGALRPGSDVKIDGVIIGKVNSITRRDDGKIRVGFIIPEEKSLEQVPSNVVARILPANVFGTNFVDLEVKGQPSPTHLEADAEIPEDNSQQTLELQKALDNIDDITNALGPEHLKSALGSAATALDGRGQKIGRIIDTVDRYLVRLTPLMPTVRTDLEKLSANLGLVNDVAPDLLDATDDALVTLNTIVEKRAALTALIAGGTTLVETSQEFLSSSEKQLVRALHNGVRLMDVLYDNRRVGITDAIKTNIQLGRTIPGAVRDGQGFIDTKAGTITFDAPPFYGPQDRPSYGGN